MLSRTVPESRAATSPRRAARAAAPRPLPLPAVAPRRRAFRALGPSGFHVLSYVEWEGPTPDAPVVLCAHGLTRNGRDFDVLAGALSTRFRVVCPDFAGRGRSDWLADPDDYAWPTYVSDMAALIGALHVEEVDWVGTSMGGVVGMMLAAQAGSPVRRLVVNDVGPRIPRAAIERLASYVGRGPRLPDRTSAEGYLRRLHASWGDLSPDQWAHLARHGLRPHPDGGYALGYDPAIGDAFRHRGFADIEFWEIWDAIRSPALVLRGAESDILLGDDARRMTRRGPGAELVEIPGVGHAPALMDDVQVAAVAAFLDA